MVVVWLALALCAGMCLAGAVTGCGASPTPAQVIDLGFWTANDQACLAKHFPTKAELDACLDYSRIAGCGDGGTFVDAAGACDHVRLSDGGLP